MRLRRFSILLTVCLLIVGGCARTSPAVGTWTGTAKVGPTAPNISPLGMATMALGGLLNGPCTLQLQDDGKGFLKVASLPERPISWSEKDGKVIVRADETPPANASGGARAKQLGCRHLNARSANFDARFWHRQRATRKTAGHLLTKKSDGVCRRSFCLVAVCQRKNPSNNPPSTAIICPVVLLKRSPKNKKKASA